MPSRNARFALQFLLDFDLDGQAVRIPAGLARHEVSLHRAMAAEQILDRAREDVMNAGPSVRRWRSLEEHERRAHPRARAAPREQLFARPLLEQRLLELHRLLVCRRAAGIAASAASVNDWLTDAPARRAPRS